MPSSPSRSSSHLTATYTSPTSPTCPTTQPITLATKTFTHALPSPSVPTTQEKVAYLSALRKSITQLQEEVNGFLTSKMEEDKALIGDAGVGVKVDEKKEEENYGEEGVEEGG